MELELVYSVMVLNTKEIGPKMLDMETVSSKQLEIILLYLKVNGSMT